MQDQILDFRFAAPEWIRIDLLRAIHAALLAELPKEGVLEFWGRHPLAFFQEPLPPKAFLHFIWGRNGKVPALYFWSVLGDLEGFLASKRIRPDRFFQLINHGPGGGPPLDPDWVLESLPLPESPAASEDPRLGLLTGLPDLARRLFPGCRMERIDLASDWPLGDSRAEIGLFLFHPLARIRETAIPDFRLFPGKLFLALPRLFGWAPFDRLEVAADMRGPAACLGEAENEAWNWKGERFRHKTRTMGRLELLEHVIETWPEAAALGETLGGLLHSTVLRMEKDFTAAGTSEPCLRAGCAYGAPVILARIGFSRRRRWQKLAAWLRRAPRTAPAPLPAWEVSARLHRELVDSLE